MSKEYVTQLDYEFESKSRVAYRIAGTRVSLDSVIINWLKGETPESIAQDFQPLPLEKIYGAIAFYLANREMIDEYLRQVESDFDKLREELREKNYLLYQKLAAHRQEKLSQAARPATELQ